MEDKTSVTSIRAIIPRVAFSIQHPTSRCSSSIAWSSLEKKIATPIKTHPLERKKKGQENPLDI